MNSPMNFNFLENKLLIFKFRFSPVNQIEFLLFRKSIIFSKFEIQRMNNISLKIL
jgi:hypothetical protein